MRVVFLPERVVETVERLRDRIAERFPGSGLAGVAAQLHEVARDSAERARRIHRPRVHLRVVVGLVLALAAWVGTTVVVRMPFRFGTTDGWQLLQTAEATISGIVFLGAAVLFLLTLEARAKRREALAAIEDLRVLAHIVDMHQLTKDPDRILKRGPATPSSPAHDLDAFRLSRYLDYCAELLALIGKIPVVYAQGSHDPVVLDAVDDIEDLTAGLCRKIWQKIVTIHHVEL